MSLGEMSGALPRLLTADDKEFIFRVSVVAETLLSIYAIQNPDAYTVGKWHRDNAFRYLIPEAVDSLEHFFPLNNYAFSKGLLTLLNPGIAQWLTQRERTLFETLGGCMDYVSDRLGPARALPVAWQVDADLDAKTPLAEATPLDETTTLEEATALLTKIYRREKGARPDLNLHYSPSEELCSRFLHCIRNQEETKERLAWFLHNYEASVVAAERLAWKARLEWELAALHSRAHLEGEGALWTALRSLCMGPMMKVELTALASTTDRAIVFVPSVFIHPHLLTLQSEEFNLVIFPVECDESEFIDSIRISWRVEMEDDDMSLALKALSDRKRLRIVTMLGKREMTVGQIADTLKMPQPLTSYHLNILRNARVVRRTFSGFHCVYALDRSHYTDILSTLAAKAGQLDRYMPYY